MAMNWILSRALLCAMPQVPADATRFSLSLSLLLKGQPSVHQTSWKGHVFTQRASFNVAVVDLLLKRGADEAAGDNSIGPNPAKALDALRDGRSCLQDDVDRARLLLARAPADRAWRRRGRLAGQGFGHARRRRGLLAATAAAAPGSRARRRLQARRAKVARP